jgi:hypothetical protein
MVGLGLKLEELLKQKGLENNKSCSFDKLVDKETLATNSPIDTRNEIANFSNTSHDTVMKVKEIKKFVPDSSNKTI